MKSLGFNLKSIYRTLEDDLVNDFFKPVLRSSTEFNLGTGFFSLAGMVELIDVILPLLQRKGSIKILTSPNLSEKDLAYFNQNYFKQEKLVEILERELYNDEVHDKDYLKLLGALIKYDYIELRVVYKENGIFHDKTGYMVLENMKQVSYLGSSNMTYNGLFNNLESISVYTSEHNFEETMDNVNYFNRIWDGKYSNLNIIPLPQAIRHKLIDYYDDSETLGEIVKKIQDKENAIGLNTKDKRRLRDYQEQALKEFEENNYIHFFEMATGTGKTFTALNAIERTQKNLGDNLFTIILLPQIDLMHQWYEDSLNFELKGKSWLIGGGASSSSASYQYGEALFEFMLGNNVNLFVVNNSFTLHLAKKIKNDKEILQRMLVIVDESHNITPNLMLDLPKSQFRLGLSATPERNDETETENILNYFKGNIHKDSFKYTLKEAIENDFLSKYKYYPIFVELSKEEYDKYQAITRKIASLMDSDDCVDQEKLKNYLLARSLIIKKSSTKLDRLESMVESSEFSFENSVIYCGPGELEDIKLTDSVSNMMYKTGNYDVKQFTSQTEERHTVLKEFEKGYYDSLIAIKCFDEGVDIPKLSKIYIMSSDTNMRQTIQRRGRVLRISKETGKEFAEIYDFVSLPPKGESYEQANSLIKSELKRVKEYMSLSSNKEEFVLKIRQIEEEANIKEEDYDTEE